MKYTLSLKDIRKNRGMTQAELGEKGWDYSQRCRFVGANGDTNTDG